MTDSKKEQFKNIGIPIATLISMLTMCIYGGMKIGAMQEKIENQTKRMDRIELRVSDTPTMAQFTELKQEVKQGFDKIMEYLRK